MNPYLLLSAVRARFRVLLYVLGATVLVTTVVSLLLPKTYVASVAMLVDSKDDQSMRTSSYESHVRERIGYMQTQVDIITSQKVARKVVNNLGLVDKPSAQAAFEKSTGGEGSIEDWLTVGLLRDLKVDTSQSSVIYIAYPADDPQFSALIANAFAKAYMDTALELRVEPSRQTAAWFDEQMKGLRENLEQAQARLNEYQKAKGLVDERYDVESLALSELATEVAKAQGRRAGIAPTGSAYTAGSQNARAELARSEAKLNELSTRLGSNHPWYQRQLAETQHLRGRLQMELGRNPEGPTPQNQRRVAELRGELEAQQSRVMELKQYRNQLAVLARDVDIAQKAYETALQNSLDKRVESRASLTNVSILHAAVPPFAPTKPRIVLNIALSVVVGTLLGLCIIYLMEMFDHRVRSQGDLKSELLVPVLAELSPWQPASAGLLGRPGSIPALPNPG